MEFRNILLGSGEFRTIPQGSIGCVWVLVGTCVFAGPCRSRRCCLIAWFYVSKWILVGLCVYLYLIR